MTWKFVEIWSSTYRRNIDIESMPIRRGVPVGNVEIQHLRSEQREVDNRIAQHAYFTSKNQNSVCVVADETTFLYYCYLFQKDVFVRCI